MVKAVIAYPSFSTSFAPYFKDLEIFSHPTQIENANLVIFSGGEDINPAIYKQENLYSMFNPRRDRVELYALELALELNKKILGVCRGHQLINAYLGGELVQDIETQIRKIHLGDHDLEILEGDSFIGNNYIFGVNSLHHQGVIKPGNGLTPTSFHKGVYESTESENIITTQFHPEFMGEWDLEMFDYPNFFKSIRAWAGE